MKRLLSPYVGAGALLFLVSCTLCLGQMPGQTVTSAPAAKNLRDALRTSIPSLQLQRTTIRDALKVLSDLGHVPITCSDAELADARVSVSLRDVTLEDALSAACGPRLFVDFRVTADGIVVGMPTLEPSKDEIVVDLKGLSPRQSSDELSKDIEEFLKEFFEIDSRPATQVRYTGDTLVMKAEPFLAEYVGRFIENLRHPLTNEASSVSGNYPLGGELRTAHKLEGRIPQTLRSSPTLGALVAALQNNAGVNVMADLSLAAAGIEMTHRIRMPEEADATLWEVLDELRSAKTADGSAPDFALRGGVLVIGRDTALNTELLTRVYDVSAVGRPAPGDTRARAETGVAATSAAGRALDIQELRRKLDRVSMVYPDAIPAPVRVWNGRLIVLSNWRNQWKVVEALRWYERGR